MERSRVIAEFWRYLPVFRAVAETGSLAEAARALHISSSALSRTISLLEESVGAELFSRAGRSLTLSARGEVFLDRVREAMRIVHDGYEATRRQRFVGPLRVHVAPALGSEIYAGLAALPREHPGLSLQVVAMPPDDPGAALRRGALDLVFTQLGRSDTTLETHRVGEVANGVWAAEPGACARWIVLEAATRGLWDDGWRGPPRARATVARVDSVAGAVALVVAGVGAAVLPRSVAAPLATLGQIVEVPGEVVVTPIVAVRRSVLTPDAAAEAIDAVRASLGSVRSDGPHERIEDSDVAVDLDRT